MADHERDGTVNPYGWYAERTLARAQGRPLDVPQSYFGSRLELQLKRQRIEQAARLQASSYTPDTPTSEQILRQMSGLNIDSTLLIPLQPFYQERPQRRRNHQPLLTGEGTNEHDVARRSREDNRGYTNRASRGKRR